ncbi:MULTISPECIES: LytS/YhcK type 5TM receptor domain-containing protein [unclassified Pseudodesulfovibrio]|uniref:LytS/YhcK type 5TM receptor domain-containing protein n=1 Tax=unclassified Pseudodesulfovibrio TaxID=2661612 RepID=UPI000FEBE523|nr:MULTISPECIES: LytS/YhcK type 5TM receptor domain-containing protein [unclassified Pseudodesulfovibrio]MCJ2164813.1 histidine kinase [Pseudodesulfovibrio sp. S3-i]RWU03816.1 transcriptional regulator [Pseudodesulfovibrio sp. S3]
MLEHILDLLVTLVGRFGAMMAIGLFVLTLSPLGKLGMNRRPEKKYRLMLAVLFGLLGIMGTYSGDIVFDSYANLRGVYVITGGLLGGPLVGFGAGLIAGGHRFLIDINGFSSIPCGLATFVEGIIAGYISTHLKGNNLNWRVAFYVGLGCESLHQLLVLTMAKPFEQAVELVKVISLPMIAVNTFGAVLFVQTLHLLFEYRSKRDSSRISQIMAIANTTVAHLRSGLDEASAQETARIIWERVPVAAVDIASNTRVLAHLGAGNDHHKSGEPLRTQATRDVLLSGKPVFLQTKEAIGCDEPDCPLTSAIIVPMRKGDRIVGCLKFYGTEVIPLHNSHFELAKGLAGLFSTQLELQDIQTKNQLLAKAEIRRLQTQINPHFLFNALNTIGAFCRTKPERARSLLSELAMYMRRNLDAGDGFAPIGSELEQVRSYLEIEQARFGDRVKSRWNLDEGVEDIEIPTLIIQPLVENGVKHGILGRDKGGTIRISISRAKGLVHVRIEDDGVGMDKTTLVNVLKSKNEFSGDDHIGVRNCNQRLEQIYGPSHTLSIVSRRGTGTSVSFTIPLEESAAA